MWSIQPLWWRCDISILLSSTVTGADKSNTCNFYVLRQADHPRCRRSRPPATSHVVLQVQLRRDFRPPVGPPVVRHNHLTSVQQPHLERRLCALLFLYIVYNVTYIDVSYIVITLFTLEALHRHGHRQMPSFVWQSHYCISICTASSSRCRWSRFQRRPSRRCVGMFTKEKMLSSLL